MPKVPFTPENKLHWRLGEVGVEARREDADRIERQTAWVNSRDTKLRSVRTRRLAELASADALRGDLMASKSWEWLAGEGATQATPLMIDIRYSYVARDPDVAAAMIE